MRLVVQRVTEARVEVEGEETGAIGAGLLVLLGVGTGDGDREARWAVDKIAGLRIFEDEDGKMNRSVADTGGAVLVVSQFTLYGDARKGRRPSFIAAADPELADALYRRVVDGLRDMGLEVATGRFRAHMAVGSVNDGPVTILLDSARGF